MRITLVIEAHAVALSLHKLRPNGWQTVRSAVLPYREGTAEQTFAERLVAVLRPTLLAWGVPTQTAVLLVPPADIGGVLAATANKTTQMAAEVKKVAAQSLPFAPQDVVLCHQSHRVEQHLDVSIAWLPRRWVDDCAATLARLGMYLDEVLPRAMLVPHALDTGQAVAWLIQQGNHLAAYKVVNGLCQLSFNIDAGSEFAGQRLQTSLNAMEGAIAPVVYASNVEARLTSQTGSTIAKAEPDWLHLAFTRWALGDAGYWQVPDKARLIATYAPALVALAALILLAMAMTTWHQHTLDVANRGLESQADRLRPNHSRLEARQRALFKLQADLLQAEAIGKPAYPLDLLALTTPALPHDTWIASYQFKGGTATIEGYGMDNSQALKALAAAKLTAKPATSSLPSQAKLAQFALTLTPSPHVAKPQPVRK